MLFDRHRTLKPGNFIVSVAALTGGAVFGRLISVLSLPLLTRLYSPVDFSELSVYLALINTLSVAMCLRLEFALTLPEDDCDAINLLALALLVSNLSVMLIVAVVTFAPEFLFFLLGSFKFSGNLWLLPFGLWMSATYAIFQYWATRKRRFKAIASTRVFQSLMGASTTLLLGWASIAPLGLMLGSAFGTGLGFFGLGADALRKDRSLLRSVNFNAMMSVLRRYQRFPKYSTFEALANSAGSQLPIVVIAATAASPEAGFLLLAIQIMLAPVNLVGAAVSQVFLSRAPQAHRDGVLPEATFEVLRNFVRYAIIPLVVLVLLAPTLVPYLFGARWERAGVVMIWMLPWVVMSFLSTPISVVMYVKERQVSALVVMLIGLVFRLGVLMLAVSRDPALGVEVLCIANALWYFSTFCYFSWVSGLKNSEIAKLLSATLLRVGGVILIVLAFFWRFGIDI